MTKPNDGGPASPTYREMKSPGLSVRDWFAGQTIRIFSMTDDDVGDLVRGRTPRHDLVAAFCYGLADAMLKEREKGVEDE